MSLSGANRKELKGREEKEIGPIGYMRSDRLSEEGGKRGDPAWMSAGAEDYGEETPLLELRRQEFEAERRAMQASFQYLSSLKSFCFLQTLQYRKFFSWPCSRED